MQVTVQNNPQTVVVSSQQPEIGVFNAPIEISVGNQEVRVVGTGVQGPPGVDGAPGAPGAPGGGLNELSEDTSPELGGDLNLGSYNIFGQLENPEFILDGGLLG